MADRGRRQPYPLHRLPGRSAGCRLESPQRGDRRRTDAPLPSVTTADLVLLPEERAAVRNLAEHLPAVCWDTLVFCAKEALYKAWFPVAGRWLDFTDAIVKIDPVAKAFQARLLVDPPLVLPQELEGRWTLDSGTLIAAITVLRGPSGCQARALMTASNEPPRGRRG